MIKLPVLIDNSVNASNKEITDDSDENSQSSNYVSYTKEDNANNIIICNEDEAIIFNDEFIEVDEAIADINEQVITVDVNQDDQKMYINPLENIVEDDAGDPDYQDRMGDVDNDNQNNDLNVIKKIAFHKERDVLRTEIEDRKQMLKNIHSEQLSKPVIKMIEENKLFQCLLCTEQKTFKSDRKNMEIHCRENHLIRLYICDVCGTDFRKRNDLSSHLDSHIEADNGDFQCEDCNRIFLSLRLFRIHKRTHNQATKTYVCSICQKTFTSLNILNEHSNTHTGKRPYKCEECNKDFASKYTWRAHAKTHGERPRPFKCMICSKSFLNHPNLLQHEKSHSDTRDYECKICSKTFTSSHSLDIHLIVHSGHKPFECSHCGKRFARKAEIRDHERTHTGERPFHCDLCPATFSQRSNLQSHKRATHFDDKRYGCSMCDKAFKRRRLLDYHIKSAHTGERPFKCDICQATFVYPEHFKKHKRIHTGEKPYQCEICGKAFNSRDNRNAHRFIHSDKKPYECLVCGAGFMRKPYLYSHMKNQGHLNDTIVVNQPRLTLKGKDIVTVNENGEMQIMTDDGKPIKITDPSNLTDSNVIMVTASEDETAAATATTLMLIDDISYEMNGVKQANLNTETIYSGNGNNEIEEVHDFSIEEIDNQKDETITAFNQDDNTQYIIIKDEN